MIVKTLEVGPFMSNCYIVGSEQHKKGMIIDPGADPNTILKAIQAEGLEIILIVATHNHTDHISAVGAVKKATGAEFAIHESDAHFSLSTGITSMLEEMTGTSYEPPSAPDRLLSGGDIIEVSDLKFTVLHTPGHTPGGISLLGHGAVFTGDALFNFGIGRTDLPGGSTAQLMDNITTKLMTLPETTIVYPGHGPSTTIGKELTGNPFLRGGFF